jgi:hypothetical protein
MSEMIQPEPKNKQYRKLVSNAFIPSLDQSLGWLWNRAQHTQRRLDQFNMLDKLQMRDPLGKPIESTEKERLTALVNSIGDDMEHIKNVVRRLDSMVQALQKFDEIGMAEASKDMNFDIDLVWYRKNGVVDGPRDKDNNSIMNNKLSAKFNQLGEEQIAKGDPTIQLPGHFEHQVLHKSLHPNEPPTIR